MSDYQKYINALRKCAKEHENDRTSTGHIIVSDLCRDTANLLETIEQEPTAKNDLEVNCVNRRKVTCYTCRFCKMDIRDGKPYCLLRAKGGKCYDHDSWESQEDVLDKIRAEIKEMTPTYHNPDWSITDLVPISEVLKLVDKYKAESGVDNGNVDN